MKSVFVIAEVGSVHDGSYGNALQMIDLAKSCGADAVKFQTHIAEAETIRDAPMPPYFKGEPRFEYFHRTAFSEEQWGGLIARAREVDIRFLSSPFSCEAIDLLENVGLEIYKIPSGEISNLPLLRKAGKTGKAVIISSGMSDWEELDAAVEAVREAQPARDSPLAPDLPGAAAGEISVLQCTSEYPCPYEDVGLNVMEEMRDRYGLAMGFSDHTATIYAPIVAVARGAQIIEKHLTFSKSMYGSDAKNSLEPEEFSRMVEGIRAAEALCGNVVDKGTNEKFSEMKRIFEKSVVLRSAVRQGDVLTEAVIALKKPGNGIPPKDFEKVLGKRATRDLPGDTVLDWGDFD